MKLEDLTDKEVELIGRHRAGKAFTKHWVLAYALLFIGAGFQLIPNIVRTPALILTILIFIGAFYLMMRISNRVEKAGKEFLIKSKGGEGSPAG